MDELVPEHALDDVVITTHCESVADFFDALSPRSDVYRSLFPRGWIFRGHSNDRYELIPTALRNDSEDLRAFTMHVIDNSERQVWSEKSVLDQFLQVSDGIGLHVPEDTQRLRSLLDMRTDLPNVWPPDDVLSLMALAQHHGIPTRLLDWSRHPLKAALFAAFGAAEAKEKTGRLSVWALCIEKLEMIDLRLRPFIVITAPSASNPNLRAQEGIFTLAKRIKPNESPIDRTAFDALLRNWVRDSRVSSPGPWFHRITLPQTLAAQLCFDLALEGMTRATLFPDFYGVVSAMRDRAKWFDGQDAPGCLRAAKNLGLSFSISVQEQVTVNLVDGKLSVQTQVEDELRQKHFVFYSTVGVPPFAIEHSVAPEKRTAMMTTASEFFRAPEAAN